MPPKLSILVPTLERRKHYLERLKNCISPQLPRDGSVEVLIQSDNGELTTGAKRNNLLRNAKGDYIAFVDEDDLIAPYYISEVLGTIDQDRPDVIGMHLIMTINNANPQHSYHSLAYKTWYDEPDKINPSKRVYYRNPNHLNPVRRELALKSEFPDQTECEDRVYSANLLPYLQKETTIHDPLYFYLVRQPKEC